MNKRALAWNIAEVYLTSCCHRSKCSLTLKAWIGYPSEHSHRVLGRGGIRAKTEPKSEETSVIRQLPCPWRATPWGLPGRSWTAIAVCLMGLALSGCETAQAPTQTVTVVDKPCFIKSWDAHLQLADGDKATAIYLVGDNIHILTDQNYDYVLAADNGSLVYSNQVVEPGHTIKGAPVMSGNFLVYAVDQQLMVFNNKGRPQRTIDLGYSVTSPPFAYGSNVYIAVNQGTGRFFAVDITRAINPIIWTILMNGPMHGLPGAREREIYIGSEDGKVRALADDRTPLWPLLEGSGFDTSGKIYGDIAVLHGSLPTDQRVFAASTDGTLYCLNSESGKLEWRYVAGEALYEGPAVTDKTIYQPVPGKGLAAIDRSQFVGVEGIEQQAVAENPYHTAKWIAKDGIRLLAEDDQFAYVLTESNTVLAVNKDTGETAFSTRKHKLVGFAAKLKSSTIYTVTEKGLVVAFHPTQSTGIFGEIVLATP